MKFSILTAEKKKFLFNGLFYSNFQLQEEYMEALNEEECARSKLEGLKTQLRQLRADANKIKSSAKKLKKLYEERDTMLCKILFLSRLQERRFTFY